MSRALIWHLIQQCTSNRIQNTASLSLKSEWNLYMNTIFWDPDGGSMFPQTSINFYQTTRCHIPKDRVLQENLKSYKIVLLFIFWNYQTRTSEFQKKFYLVKG
jgi:hypothetical protein